MGHYFGMRLSRVLARETSMMPNNGTGEVPRSDCKDLCESSEGKPYHADLNASYNIGARFFIRTTIKPLFDKRRLAFGAKIPEVLVRTGQTLSPLSCVDRLGIKKILSEAILFMYMNRIIRSSQLYR